MIIFACIAAFITGILAGGMLMCLCVASKRDEEDTNGTDKN